MAELYQSVRISIDQALAHFLQEERFPPIVHDPLAYVLLGAGKRLRPILVLWAAEIFGKPANRVLRAACGVECLHAFTLVHDDLPGLDDADMRRGQLSCHEAFGIGPAILTGDALFALGVQWIAQNLQAEEISSSGRVLAQIGEVFGGKGIIGGQFDDIGFRERTIKEWNTLYQWKTSKLFQLALQLGGTLAGACQEHLSALLEYGLHLGLAFQMCDDLLDLESGEPSLVKQLGERQAKIMIAEETGLAQIALTPLPQRASVLSDLAVYLQGRSR
jgi:geranylgeranyl diphosphate synthase type II